MCEEENEKGKKNSNLSIKLKLLFFKELSHEPWSEFEKLYVNKEFPSKDELNEIRIKRSILFTPQKNKNKMDENIKNIEELPNNSKFLGMSILNEFSEDEKRE